MNYSGNYSFLSQQPRRTICKNEEHWLIFLGGLLIAAFLALAYKSQTCFKKFNEKERYDGKVSML